ncbi:MAG: MlaD family protein [Flavobacteriaceae bacterium]|nr:MlaD family protein [Flavobacteriaceae bacterium]MDG2313869.1 MlaD family protein [Flavobacteriaceae bacterium]
MKITPEIKTAIMMIAVIGLFIFGFSYLKSNDVFSKDRTFYAVYNDVEGMAVGTPVTINGFQVGSVQNISFLNSTGKLVIKFRVENKFQFSASSTAKIYEAGLIGGKAIAIVPSSKNIPLAKSGDTLQAAISPGLTELVNNKLSPLQDKIEAMIVNADTALQNINSILDEPTRNNLKSSVEGFSNSMQELDKLGKSLNAIVSGKDGQLTNTMSELNTASKNLATITSDITDADIGATLKDLQTVTSSLSNILKNIEQGKGSAGKLLNDDALYSNLSEASKALNLLLEDMREHPKRYVHFSIFGKKQQPYKPTE